MIGQIMKKTHKYSYIERFHLRSQLAKEIFSSGGRLVVLQIMALPESEFLAEVVDERDYKYEEYECYADGVSQGPPPKPTPPPSKTVGRKIKYE